MAGGANLNVKGIIGKRGSCLEDIAAAADYRDFVIRGMDVRFHQYCFLLRRIQHEDAVLEISRYEDDSSLRYVTLTITGQIQANTCPRWRSNNVQFAPMRMCGRLIWLGFQL